MHVGVCKLVLRLPGSRSLKEKRRVVSSLSSRLRNRFNVAVAEVADNETWGTATLGVSCVSNSTRHVAEVMSSVVEFVERSRDDADLVHHEIETLSGF